MKALVVHAHPEPGSFVSAMRDTVVETLTEQGAEVAQSDLYAMRFNPVLSSADFGERSGVEHPVYALEQRNAYKEGRLAPDIVAEIDKVQAADVVVFTFPLFWFSVPAILKGWIDRVFISGVFYGGRRVYGAGGMAGKRALAAFSLGGRPHMFGDRAIHGELEQGMLRHFLQGALGYAGFDVVEPFVAYNTPYIAHDARVALLEDLRRHVAGIADLPVLPMPDLACFDATFAPIPAE